MFEEAHLREDAERALYRAIEDCKHSWSSDNGSINDAEYEIRLRSVGSLAGPLAKFFDDVLVIAEDDTLRRNRLALLNSLASPIYRIADISKLGGHS